MTTPKYAAEIDAHVKICFEQLLSSTAKNKRGEKMMNRKKYVNVKSIPSYPTDVTVI